jgi:ABC-2 type transport system ATP-binding protein
MTPAVQTRGLTRLFPGGHGVSDLDLTVPRGSLYGFLGPNGAGKTTTVRLLLDLLRPDRGEIELFGHPLRRDRREALALVGSLVESPSLYPHLSGWENLEISRRLLGLPTERIPEALFRVGLMDAAHRRVREYSLGMRQRLGIAHALLGDPRVLILDEPANGLDPEGIRWMRGLLRDFADRGGTVLLSSHLLHEVEAVADRLVMIARGEIVAQGEKSELLAASGVIVRSPDRTGLRRALAEAQLPSTNTSDGAQMVEAEPEVIGQVALDAGIVLSELRRADSAGLEDMFLSLTGTTGDAEDASASTPKETV